MARQDNSGDDGRPRTGKGATGGKSAREERLAAALKANLRRRKAQARARAAQPEEDGDE